MIKNFIEKSWLLIVASLLFGVLLAGANTWLAPRIIQNEIDKFNKKASAMIPDATGFESISEDKEDKMELTSARGKAIKVDVKKATDADGNCVGWAFAAEGSGFADKIKLVIATDAKFENLKGFGVLLSNETPGFGDKINKPEHYFVKQFTGSPADEEELKLVKIGDWKIVDDDIDIVAITGATVTSDAVVSIFNTYLKQIRAKLTEKGLL
jgi:electron transport complex protein RnfG